MVSVQQHGDHSGQRTPVCSAEAGEREHWAGRRVPGNGKRGEGGVDDLRLADRSGGPILERNWELVREHVFACGHEAAIPSEGVGALSCLVGILYQINDWM